MLGHCKFICYGGLLLHVYKFLYCDSNAPVISNWFPSGMRNNIACNHCYICCNRISCKMLVSISPNHQRRRAWRSELAMELSFCVVLI